MNTEPNRTLAQEEKLSVDPLPVGRIGEDGGRKLDYNQEVHDMTEELQSLDKHYVTVMSTENRVSANQLS